MSSTSGTSADYKVLLTDLRDYITGLGWTAVRDTSTTSPQPEEFEMIFRGNGDASPEKAIYFGIKTYKNASSGYYNWQLRGMTGFNDGSPIGSVDFDSQPGISPNAYVPLINSTISYWFFVTGRRVCMVAKTGTNYQFLYAGFMDPTAFDNEYPYPLLIMGSSYLSTILYSSNAIEYSSSVHPGGTSSTATGADNSAAYLRFVDGTWYPVKNFYSNGNEVPLTQGIVNVWPRGDYDANAHATDYQVASTVSTDVHALFHSNSQGGTPVANLLKSENGATDISPMFPATLYMAQPSKQIIGEIHNVFWVSAGGGVTAEDVITDASVSPNENYLVFQNIHRTDSWTYLAIKDS